MIEPRMQSELIQKVKILFYPSSIVNLIKNVGNTMAFVVNIDTTCLNPPHLPKSYNTIYTLFTSKSQCKYHLKSDLTNITEIRFNIHLKLYL